MRQAKSQRQHVKCILKGWQHVALPLDRGDTPRQNLTTTFALLYGSGNALGRHLNSSQRVPLLPPGASIGLCAMSL